MKNTYKLQYILGIAFLFVSQIAFSQEIEVPKTPNATITPVYTIPVYPNGNEVFRTLVATQLDLTPFYEEKENLKAEATIYVSKKGKMTKVEVTGNNKKFNKSFENAIRKVGKPVIWTPGTLNSTTSDSYLTLPLAFNFTGKK